jgi:hypothetical protein
MITEFAQPGRPPQAGLEALGRGGGPGHPAGGTTLAAAVGTALEPAQAVVHLDAAYDWAPCRQALAERTHARGNHRY